MGYDIPVLCGSDHAGHASEIYPNPCEVNGEIPVQCAVLLCGTHEEEWDNAPSRVCSPR